MVKYILVIMVIFSLRCFGEVPSTIYLTWIHDPTSTMMIQWHTSKKEKSSKVYYQKKGVHSWNQFEGTYHQLHRSTTFVHQSELTDLEEDTIYNFRIGEQGKIYQFRTLPKGLEKKSVQFIVGGDVYDSLELFRRMNRRIVAMNPDFVLLGGDIAYAEGRHRFFKNKDLDVKRWQAFCKEWGKMMVGPDGRLIPLLVMVGNHDVKRVQGGREGFFFYDLFAMPTPGISYRVLDGGNYMSLFLLDSGHSHPIEGVQTLWLKKSLEERSEVPYKIAVYHVAAYPSVYLYNRSTSTKIREFWVPLFERFHIQAAFEHHNHAFKRTHSIKEGKVDPDGVVYLGDGSWGVPPRQPQTKKDVWYLAKSAKKNCIWQVTLKSNQGQIEAFDDQGLLIDQLTFSPIISQKVELTD